MPGFRCSPQELAVVGGSTLPGFARTLLRRRRILPGQADFRLLTEQIDLVQAKTALASEV